MAKMMG